MQQRKKSPYLLILGCVIMMMLTQTAVGLVFTTVKTIPLAGSGMSAAELDAAMLEILNENMTLILILSHVINLFLIWLMARHYREPLTTFTGLSLKTKPSMIVLGLLAGASASIWLTIVLSSIPWPEAFLKDYLEVSSNLTTVRPVLDFLAVVLISPLIEEILFRGIIYDALCRIAPAGAAVVFQGVFFGLVHGTAIWMLYATLMGCMLGYVRKQTGSLRPCIAMHIAFNGVSSLNLLTEESGGNVFLFAGSALFLMLALYGINFRMRPENEKKN